MRHAAEAASCVAQHKFLGKKVVTKAQLWQWSLQTQRKNIELPLFNVPTVLATSESMQLSACKSQHGSITQAEHPVLDLSFARSGTRKTKLVTEKPQGPHARDLGTLVLVVQERNTVNRRDKDLCSTCNLYGASNPPTRHTQFSP